MELVSIFFSNLVEGGGGGLTVSGVSRNRRGFLKCVAIQKRLGIPDSAVSANVLNIFMFMLYHFRPVSRFLCMSLRLLPWLTVQIQMSEQIKSYCCCFLSS
jgi:hypothetical protein